MNRGSMLRRRALGALATLTALAATSLVPSGALAQGTGTYPSQPIRIVVPYPAGGATDTLGRTIATKLQEAWGQPVI
ncbi:MAG TPA: tripartite tricarboxylate transporter substrate binding protein, partial [Ideonella sp.]|nr:tripartite tricarboxylate transporter substrate binding protein [Ideonella sp.]